VFSCDFNIKMLLFELDFEEVSKKKLRECWSQLCRIRCTVSTEDVMYVASLATATYFPDDTTVPKPVRVVDYIQRVQNYLEVLDQD